MKTLIFSLGPIFKDSVHGGSQKILREVARHLGEEGNDVKIYCTERDDNNRPFELSENVQVVPSLRFKQTFPLPYKTAPYNLANIVNTLQRETQEHDVFYVHDAGLNFPFLMDDIPTVVSLRDFLYPETLVGGFCFDRDKIIVNSEYTRDSFLKTVGSYREGLDGSTVYIPNGIDTSHFNRRDASDLRDSVGLVEGDIPVIYPHRPEESKGIFQALEVIALLKKQGGLDRIKLLMPRYIDLNVSTEFEELYRSVEDRAQELGIGDNILFHPWMSYGSMPEYYSLGRLSLSLGNFIESFPNVSLESLACGTPSISSRVGAHRYVLPESIEPRVDFGDAETSAEIAFSILTDPDYYNIDHAQRFISDTFDFQTMLGRYAETILGCKKQQALQLKNTGESDVFELPPWCYVTDSGEIYNDYKYGYVKDKRLSDVVKEGGKVDRDENNQTFLEGHVREGNLVCAE